MLRREKALALEVAALAVVEPRRREVGMDLVDRGLADRRQNLFEREARRDCLAHLVERESLFEAQVLRREPLLLEATLNDVDDLFDFERLEDVVVRAALHRVDRRLDRA